MSLRIKIIQFLIHINEQTFFFPKLKKFYKNHISKKNAIIFDVGSNKGQSIDFFNTVYDSCEIYAFEPNVKLYQKLKKKNFNNENIHLHNIGLSEKRGELVFNENILDETSSFEKMKEDSIYALKKAKVLGIKPDKLIVKSYKVETITLNEFLKINNIQNIDILKIDVEGHEYEVLRGLFSRSLNTKIKYIQIESQNNDIYVNKIKEINKLLALNNFVMLKSIKHGFGDFDELIYVLN